MCENVLHLFHQTIKNQIKMKITIELTEQQVCGIKLYLKETSHERNFHPQKKDIQREIQGIVSSELQLGSLSDYIRQFNNTSTK